MATWPDSNRPGSAWASLLLAIAIIVSVYFIAKTYREMKPAERTIHVTGIAEEEVSSDFVTWTILLYGRNRDLESAYKKVQEDLKKTLEYFEGEGFSPEQLKVSETKAKPVYRLNNYGKETEVIDSYCVVQAISTMSDDVNLIERLAREASSLIAKGVEIESLAPVFEYKELPDLEKELLKKASENARHKAQQIVSSSRGSLGSLTGVPESTVSVLSIYPQMDTDEGAGLQKKVKAVVQAEYEIR